MARTNFREWTILSQLACINFRESSKIAIFYTNFYFHERPKTIPFSEESFQHQIWLIQCIDDLGWVIPAKYSPFLFTFCTPNKTRVNTFISNSIFSYACWSEAESFLDVAFVDSYLMYDIKNSIFRMIFWIGSFSILFPKNSMPEKIRPLCFWPFCVQIRRVLFHFQIALFWEGLTRTDRFSCKIEVVFFSPKFKLYCKDFSIWRCRIWR